jgi:hypothetical protein
MKKPFLYRLAVDMNAKKCLETGGNGELRQGYARQPPRHTPGPTGNLRTDAVAAAQLPYIALAEVFERRHIE